MRLRLRTFLLVPLALLGPVLLGAVLLGVVALLDGVDPRPRPISPSDAADEPQSVAPALATARTSRRASDATRRTEALLAAHAAKPNAPPAGEVDDPTEEETPPRRLRERDLARLILNALRADDRGALRDLLSDRASRARISSLTVRLAESRDASEEEDLLARAATDPDAALREFGLHNLAGVGFATRAVRAAIEAGLCSPDAATRVLAVEALGGGGDARPYLLGAASDPHPEVRRVALGALGRDPSGSADAVSVLARGLDDADSEVRAAAARSLGRMGHAAADVLPALERARNDPVPAVASLASRAVAAVLEP